MFGFIYNKLGYEITSADWLIKEGKCEKKDTKCGLCQEDNFKKIRCSQNLIGHCCKHVVHGMESERERYKQTMEKLSKGDCIPPKINGVDDQVIENYHDMSKMVLEKCSISIAGESNNIRVVCEGQDDLEGVSDFLGFEKTSRYCNCLGIISSYFNYASAETYTLYRLCHQKFFDGLEKGKNISPVISVESEHWDKNTYCLSVIDNAFDQRKIFYKKEKKDEDYSKGVMYYYFHDKYEDDLNKMYSLLSKIQPLQQCKRPRRLIWDETDEDLKSVIKIYENVYCSKIIMEYLLKCEDRFFDPTMEYGKEKEKYAKDFADVLEKYTTRYIKKDKTKLLYELIIQRRYLERKANAFEMHYGGDRFPLIMKAIRENETKDPSVGSIADYSAYSVVSSIAEYFMAVYVFVDNCIDTNSINGEEQKEILKGYVGKVRDFYKLIDVDDNLFKEWRRILDDLFHIKGKTDQLNSKLKKLSIEI